MRVLLKWCVVLGIAFGTVTAWGAETRGHLRSHRPAPIPKTRPLPPPTKSTLAAPVYPAGRPAPGKEILPGIETGRDRNLYMEPLPDDLYGNSYRGEKE